MSRTLRRLFFLIAVVAMVIGFYSIALGEEEAVEVVQKGSSIVWWMWPIILFVFTFLLGILAVVAGVGGGVLFVPIVSSFFPFNLDFVRGAGLLVALTGALSAGPGLLKRGLANLRLALPMALIASTCSIFGAMVGLALPTNVVQTALGGTIIMIVIIMATAKRSDFPTVEKADTLSTVLRISGIYYEESAGKEINWQIHRTPLGLALFVLIGFMAGMFGLGAGWANVPVLNLLLGAPLKISVATSVFLLSITDTAAAWVYVNKGAVLPLIAAPSVAGMMLGTRIGVRILAKAKPKAVKWIVISFLFLAGFRALLKGLGIWG
ncbi:MAG: sulfite exporter TauE/SafE family protein [Nitrospirae bacterium]|nr:sulfite exporter TauE/SafE family protein [Nitrospirota bacterium]